MTNSFGYAPRILRDVAERLELLFGRHNGCDSQPMEESAFHLPQPILAPVTTGTMEGMDGLDGKSKPRTWVHAKAGTPPTALLCATNN